MKKRSELIEKLTVCLSKEASWELSDAVLQNPKLLPMLVDIIELETHPISNKAAWVLSNLVNDKAEPAVPYFDRVVELALHADHQGVRRECVKTLKLFAQKRILNEKYGGKLIDISFEILEKPVSIAEKHYCLEILDVFLHSYPDLKHEYKSILELNYMQAQGPFKARLRKRLQAVE
ncbi:MAG: hypothetical protein GC193_04710 [Cryomorphaceae bacterium]|nr:hypothetical protein [Cryomorphaceae bacterium]